MARITPEEKLDTQRNIRGFISDYRREHKKIPTTSVIANQLSLDDSTIRRYKIEIRKEDKKTLTDRFADELVAEVEDLLKTFDENKITLKELRDSTIPEIRLAAMRQLQETQLDKLRVLQDGPEYLGLFDNEESDTETVRL